MKKLTFFWSLIATMLCGLTAANAQSVTPYDVDFDTEISTASGFKVAPGWKHIVPSSRPATYAYTVSSYYTVGGSGGSLSCAQNSSSYPDYLVTPKVSGNVSLQVCQSYYTSKIEFYKVDEAADGTLTIGDKIDFDGTLASSYTDPYGSNTFVTVSFNLDTPTRVAILAGINRTMYIDNFHADYATIALSPELTVSSVNEMKIGSKVISSVAGDYANCDENNDLPPVSFTVTVTNTGERAIEAGEDNYAVSIVDYSNSNYVLATQPISQGLAVGESTQVTVVANINYISYPFDRHRFDVRENMTNTSAVGMWVEVNPYISKFALTLTDNSNEIESGTAVAFGKITETATKSYLIRNSGAAPLQITSITAPDGYTLNVAAPLTVAASSSQQLDITLPATTSGIYSGDLTIVYKAADGSNAQHTLALTGTVLDPTKWYATFEDGFPSGSQHSSNWETASSTYYTPTARFIQSKIATTNLDLFISPLLHATANEEVQFDVARRTTNSGEDYHLAVYYSTDRENWTLLRNVLNTELPTNTVGGTWSSAYAFQTFSTNVPVEGDVYLGFSAGYVWLDNIYGLTPVDVAHDIIFTSNLPTDGQANHPLTIKATAQNLLAQTESGATLKYYVGETVAAETTVEDLAKGVEKSLTLSYTPYTAGTYTTKLVLQLADGTTYESAATQLVISEEQASATKEVSAGTKGTSANVPMHSAYGYSVSETVYTAEEIGLPAGTQITGLAYKGYRTSTERTVPITVWLQETSDTAPAATDATFSNIGDDYIVFDGEYTLRQAGTSASSMIDGYLSFNLAQPITYNGGNLRVAMLTQAGGSGISATTFETYNTENTRQGRKDSSLDGLTFTTSTFPNPVLYLSIVKEPSTFSGVLSIENADGTTGTISGATVTLTSGTVKYQGQTDAQGKYSFNVLQDDKTYTLSTDYAAKNYFPLTEEQTTVVFSGTSVEKNLTLVEAVDFYIDAVDAPEKGKVDVAYTVTATATNYNKTAMAADDYTATLYVDGEAVATAETADLGEKEQHTFTFTYTPQSDGQKTGYVKFVGPTRSVQSDDFTFAVEGIHNVIVGGSLPTTGEVNSPISFTATVTNALETAEEAETYTVKYYVDGQAVAEATAEQQVALTHARSTAFALSFVPHAAGEFTTYVEVVFNDGKGTFRSEETTITVKEEVAAATVEVIPATTTGRYAPINPYYKGTQSEAIYTAEQLGIGAGTKLTAIAFKYYGSFTFPLDVYLANTTDNTVTSAGKTPVSTDDMTLVYHNPSVTISGGSSSSLQTLTLKFDEPFEFDGTNLRLFVDSKYASSYSSSAYFAQNANYPGQSTVRFHDTNINNASFSSCNVPALTISYEQAPTKFSGTLTLKREDGTVETVAGATVTLTSADDVQYSGTTDDNGAYAIAVVQADKTYQVSVANLPEGTPELFPVEQTVTFSGSDVAQDIQLVEASNFYLSNLDAPATGEVNSPYTVTVSGTNYNDIDLGTGEYTATLYVDGEPVATAEAVAIGEGEQLTYTFTYTPHSEGTVTAHVAFTAGNKTSTSNDFAITIGEERGVAETTFGNVTGTRRAYDGTAPVRPYDKNSKSETVYTAEQIGLDAGTKLYKFYYNGQGALGRQTDTEITGQLKVWLQNTDETSNRTGQTDDMTLVYDAQTTLQTGTTVLEVPFDAPFTYTGENLRVVFLYENQNDYQGDITFEYDSDAANRSSIKSSDTNSNVVNMTAWDSRVFIPVTHVEYEASKLITGRVVNSEDNHQVEGAVVKAVSGDVVYTATTDANGYYTLNIKKADLTYKVSASHADYGYSEVKTVDFSSGDDVTLNLSLTKTHFFIVGQVTDKRTGESISGASIIAVSGDIIYTATTDDDGQYSLTIWELDNTYTVTASASGYEVEPSVQVTVTDESVEQNFQLTPVHVNVHGYVTDINSQQPIADATVTLVSEDGNITLTATTDASGYYSIDVYDLNTTFTATVEADNYTSPAPEDITVATSVAKDFGLTPEFYIISGTVTDSQTHAAIAGARVKAQSTDSENLYIVETDGDGHYEIVVYALGKTYKVSVTADNYEASDEVTLTIVNADATQDFELTPAATTGIDAINSVNGESLQGKDVYDLKGRKVNTSVRLPRGVYIVEGRKVIVK